ncbi:STAS domain-containing protein [Streptosporangium sp. NBC_01639]|uniref:STAS domain-containing protein n=1 Tax=unclassified Streptosporangium TaxID=2632669 RepID=UPI002DD96783|nr:STAS domain-containing protein [Streptosporangium sp. NBC_01756]WSC85958.1 STAS domain-containing protein [Streptosporangium sp. NBC_01756]WTD55367.1 STAS domain-containing protein [Streptosporangium sp. NBC_01639]
MSDLKTTIRRSETGPVVSVAGELDHHSSPQLREALDHLTLYPGDHLVLDLSALSFCDSSGITAFIVARNKALDAQAGIALAGVPEHTARVLRIIGLDQIFPIHSDTEAAITAWTRSPSRP